MKTIEEYIEQICREHRDIRHEEGGQCHFSCTSDDDLTKMARTMRYPCVRLDVGEVYFTGESISETATIIVLDHVRDTGNTREVLAAFQRTKKIMVDIIKRMSRDKRNQTEPLMARFNRSECEGRRIYLDSASLFGYFFNFNYSAGFNDEDRDNAFTTDV